MSKKKHVKKVAKKAAKKTHHKAASKKAAPKKKAVAKKSSPKKATKKAPSPPTAPKHNSVGPYLTFPGNCEEAFNFYKSVFGGKFDYIGRFNEMPPSPEHPLSPEQANKIMHVSLPIGPGSFLFGSDSSEEFGHTTNVGNNISLVILV